MVLAAGCGRSSLEPEDLDASATSSSSGTSGNPTACGPATCSNGCCDSAGQCQTGRNTRACGAGGGSCKDCVTTGFDTCTDARVCAKTVTNCGPSNCPSGCCAAGPGGTTQCLSGTEATACGKSGGACTNCEDQGRACDLSTRTCGNTTCDATNCAGCCIGDLCLPGNSNFSCGENGGQCGRCPTGQVCKLSSIGGGHCEGSPLCGPANCGGCCDAAGNCQSGTDDFACGRLGQRCDSCAFDEQCTPDGRPGARTCQPFAFCGPGNCDGCCLGDICIPFGATSDDLCGIKGQQCMTCGPNQSCNTGAGFCETIPEKCGPDNCDGCCVGDVCARGLQNTACGAGGEVCDNCKSRGQDCDALTRTCKSTPKCDQFSCPNGCCQGNTCMPGTSDTQCGGFGFDGGIGGQQCQNCALFGQTCQNHQCISKCGPGNCNGCCNASGVCVGGISSTACGQFGDSCDNCTARGSFCNGLVSPRSCNDAQKECPAPYSTCPPGTTTQPVKEKQSVCSDFDLDDISGSCSTGSPDDFFCQLIIGEKSPACQTCINNFIYPFARRTGLFNCAATFVDGKCRQDMGCTTDCDQTSCENCSSTGTENSCYTLVNANNGQCNKYSSQTTCANDALQGGELCSQFSYPDFSGWLREVGGHFCGDGL